MSVYDIAAGYRAQLLAGDRDAAAQLLAAYAEALTAIEASVNTLLAAVAGDQPTEGQLVRMAQYADVLETLRQQYARLALQSATTIEQQQIAALLTGAAQARDQLLHLIPDGWATLHLPAATDALAAMIGIAGDGSPLHALLNQSGQAAADATAAALVRGIIAGQGSAAIARAVRNAWGQGAARSVALARTETMRAYREANRNAYQANSDVVGGWEWVSAHSRRTCPACLALDGRIFPLDEPQPAHVNCRCTCAPVLRGRELPQRQTGGQWLANQPADMQRGVLGQAGYAAYANGADLADFVSYRHDRDWGKQALWAVPSTTNI